MATVAEVLKGSPFRKLADLSVAVEAVAANAGSDPDRVEFAALFAKARSLLGFGG